VKEDPNLVFFYETEKQQQKQKLTYHGSASATTTTKKKQTIRSHRGRPTRNEVTDCFASQLFSSLRETHRTDQDTKTCTIGSTRQLNNLRVQTNNFPSNYGALYHKGLPSFAPFALVPALPATQYCPQH